VRTSSALRDRTHTRKCKLKAARGDLKMMLVASTKLRGVVFSSAVNDRQLPFTLLHPKIINDLKFWATTSVQSQQSHHVLEKVWMVLPGLQIHQLTQRAQRLSRDPTNTHFLWPTPSQVGLCSILNSYDSLCQTLSESMLDVSIQAIQTTMSLALSIGYLETPNASLCNEHARNHKTISSSFAPSCSSMTPKTFAYGTVIRCKSRFLPDMY
jgi:hypothetical protein